MTMTAAVLAAASILGGCAKPQEEAPPPVEVYVAPVVLKDVPEYLELVGQTEGFQDVEIRARVEGFLERVNFREGSFVRKGELLYQIDPKPFEAAVQGAIADQAKAQAGLDKTETDVARYTPLVVKQAISKQELDNALSGREAARAQVKAARAAVEEASLHLGYARVFSPINGLIGTTQVKAGNLVGRGTATLLATVSQIDPMIVRVAVTEADYLRVVRRSTDRAGREPRTGDIEMTLADATVHPQRGRVGPVERAVDPATGTLGMQLIFPNPQSLLRPGQFARVRVLVDTRRDALLVPQRAVQELQNLYSVAVVDANDTVTFRNVTVGPRLESLWVIETGLKAGERVVVEGLQAIREGQTVRTRPMTPPPPAAPAAPASGPVTRAS